MKKNAPPAPSQPSKLPQDESPLAIASLVTGTLSLVGLGFLTGLPAIILAVIGLATKAKGHRFLIVGLICGLIGTLVSLCMIILFFWIILTDSVPSGPYPRDTRSPSRQQPIESTKV